MVAQVVVELADGLAENALDVLEALARDHVLSTHVLAEVLIDAARCHAEGGLVVVQALPIVDEAHAHVAEKS